MKEKPNIKNWKKPVLIVAIVLLALILTAILVVAIVGTYVFDQLGSAEPSETISVIPPEMEDFETDPPETTQEPTGEPTNPTQGAEGSEPTQPDTQPTQPPQTRPNFAWPEVERLQSEDVINILLVGKDASSSGRPRTDSMILLSINKKTNSLSMVSLMRDLYVQIPGGYSDNRINAAYRFGGIALLNATVEKNFGIVIDGNVEVDFEQFAKIIDILGGVDIELTAAEAKYLNNRGHYGTMTAGVNHLGGAAALEYCRIRSIDSDHQRTERQRKLLLTVAESAKKMTPTQMLGLIDQVLPYVQTNLSASEIIELATAGLGALTSGNGIKSGKVPQSGQYYGATIMGMQVMVPDLYQCNQYLKAFIYG